MPAATKTKTKQKQKQFVTFEQMAGPWMRIKGLSYDKQDRLENHACCVVGFAWYGLERRLTSDEYSKITEKYYAKGSENFCPTCTAISLQFYRIGTNSAIAKFCYSDEVLQQLDKLETLSVRNLKKVFAKHMNEEHRSVLKKRGLLK